MKTWQKIGGLIIFITIFLFGMYRLVFYRHDIKFEEINRVLNTVDHGGCSFYPYGFVLIHNEAQLEYYKDCIDPWIVKALDNPDFEKFSYLMTFGDPVNRLSYCWYDTFRYDYSPSYAKLWKDNHQLLIVDYRDFTYRGFSIEDNAFQGNDSIYLYRLPHLPFLSGLQGM